MLSLIDKTPEHQTSIYSRDDAPITIGEEEIPSTVKKEVSGNINNSSHISDIGYYYSRNVYMSV